MSSALISPSEIIKCVQLLRKAVKATRNDKAGSAAKFEEAEQHLSRFEAVIAKYRSSHEAPPEVDAAIEACESAIKELDRKLNKYRGTFGDLETRRIRLKDFHVKVKFFNAVDGYLKEFDEAIARELRVFELWERVYEKEQRDSQVETIQKRLDELLDGQRLMTRHVIKQTMVSTWSEEAVIENDNESKYSEGTVSRRTMSRTDLVMGVIRNDRLQKVERIVEKRYGNETSAESWTKSSRNTHNFRSENTELGTQVGAALGFIVKGLIGLLDTCVYRPRFSLLTSTMDWDKLRDIGLHIDLATPYRNRTTTTDGKVYALDAYFQNRSQVKLLVFFEPAATHTNKPEDDKAQMARDGLQAYSHCRDLNGTWLIDNRCSTDCWAFDASHEACNEDRGTTEMTPGDLDTTTTFCSEQGHVWHPNKIEGILTVDGKAAIALTCRNGNFLKRYMSCMKALEKSIQAARVPVPGDWPDRDRVGKHVGWNKASRGVIDPFSLGISEKSGLPTIDGERGPWMCKRVFKATLRKGNAEYWPSAIEWVESENRWQTFQFTEAFHSSDDLNFCNFEGIATTDDLSKSQAITSSYIRLYGRSGAPVTKLSETLFTIFRQTYFSASKDGPWEPESRDTAITVIVHTNWDEKPTVFDDDDDDVDIPDFVWKWINSDYKDNL